MKIIHLFHSKLAASFQGRKLVYQILQNKKLAMSSSSKNTGDSFQPERHNNHDASSYTATGKPATTEWKALETQVGGHQFTHGEYDDHQKLGIVDIGNGLILKSLQNPPRGTRELNFYQKAFSPNCDDTDLLELRPFMSPFHGIEEKGKAKFLKLANLTNGYKCPCVIDLKMGRVTYDQEATAEKIIHEVGKYPPLKVLGFQITGMMIYNPVTQSNEQFGKAYCKNLTEDNITHDGLGRFFQLYNNDLRIDVIQQLVPKLKKLEAWFLKQKKFSFIASSLLIVYEGSTSTKTEVNISGKTDLPNTDQNENLNNPTSTKDASNISQNANPQSGPKTGLVNAADSISLNIHVEKQIIDREIMYDNDSVKEVGLSEGTSSQTDALQFESLYAKGVEVHLIDFAHAFPADDIDHNFLFGLQKLIICLQTLIK